MSGIITALLIAILGALNIACFIVGAKVGQTVSKGETIETPKIPNPMEVIEAKREKKAAKAEQEKIDTIMRNIECYNGTGIGQEDVPKG